MEQQANNQTTTSNAVKPVVVNNQPSKADKEVKRAKIALVLKIIFLFITLITIIRVPYCGSYIDGIFDYVLGQAKYALYAIALGVELSLFFHWKFANLIKKPKFIILTLVGLLSIGCIISGIYDMVQYFNVRPSFVDIMNSYHNDWKNFFIATDYAHFFNFHISGGILAILISYIFNFLSYAMLALVAIIILFICIFIIFNVNYKSSKLGLKFRSSMIKKLGGTFKYDSFNELKNNNDAQPKFDKATKSDIETAAKENLDAIPFALLPSTDVEHQEQNFRKAITLQEKLIALFKKESVDCVEGKINVYCSYTEIAFETKSNAEIKKIISLQPKIADVTKLDNFNISYRGNFVNIEYRNLFYSKLSLRTVCLAADHVSNLTAIFGITKENKPCLQDFKLSPSALIIGKKGSGSATLIVLMALTACYTTSEKDLDLVILNSKFETTYGSFVNLPHTNGKVYEKMPEVIDKLHELQDVMNKRIDLFKVHGVSNLHQYNNVVKAEKLKNILVLIPNAEDVINESFQNNKILQDLLAHGKNVGIFLVLQSYSVNSHIIDPKVYDYVSEKYILSLETDEESQKIFGNSRGHQLHGNGDCLHFAAKTKKIENYERIQICNISFAELNSDIDIIKTYYECKNRPKTMTIKSEPVVEVKPEFKVEQPKVEQKPEQVVKSEQPKPEVKLETKPQEKPTIKSEQPSVEVFKIDEEERDDNENKKSNNSSNGIKIF